MTTVREVKALATAALLLVAVAACADDERNPRSESSSTPPTTTSPPPTATPPSDSEVASRAASRVVRRYYAVVDELGRKPSAPLSKLSSVATSAQRSAMSRVLRSQRQAGQRQVGRARVARLKVQSVNLDNSDPKVGKVPIVTVDVCVDVRAVDILDKSGSSVISSTRPNSGWTRYTVANFDYAKNPAGGWRIEAGRDLKKKPCVP